MEEVVSIPLERDLSPSLFERITEKWQDLCPADKVHYGLMASFVLLNVADAATTAGFLSLGGYELNPLMRQQLDVFGPTLALASKVILGSTLSTLSLESAKRALDFLGVERSTLVPDIALGVLSVGVGYAVINNLFVINQLLK